MLLQGPVYDKLKNRQFSNDEEMKKMHVEELKRLLSSKRKREQTLVHATQCRAMKHFGWRANRLDVGQRLFPLHKISFLLLTCI